MKISKGHKLEQVELGVYELEGPLDNLKAIIAKLEEYSPTGKVEVGFEYMGPAREAAPYLIYRYTRPETEKEREKRLKAAEAAKNKAIEAKKKKEEAERKLLKKLREKYENKHPDGEGATMDSESGS